MDNHSPDERFNRCERQSRWAAEYLAGLDARAALEDVPPGERGGLKRAMRRGDGIHPESMPPLGEPLAGWVGTQVRLQDLVVEAALTGDVELALRALVEDPASPRDEAACRRMFDELYALQKDKLPF